jgi:hypothetical protein
MSGQCEMLRARQSVAVARSGPLRREFETCGLALLDGSILHDVEPNLFQDLVKIRVRNGQESKNAPRVLGEFEICEVSFVS